MSFSTDLTKFVKKSKGNVDQIVQEVGMGMTRQVIERTPFDTGRARANWQVGEALPQDIIHSVDKRGNLAIKNASEVIKGIKAGGVFYIANNVEYIGELEYGSSEQAPNGMMRITVKMYHQFLQNAVRKLS